MLPQRRRRREGEVFIASSSSLRSRQFAPAKRGGERRRTGRRGGRKKQEKENRHACFLSSALFSRVEEISLPRALHTSVIPSNRVSSSSVVVANFCTPSAHRPTAGRTRYIVPAEAKTQRARCGARREGGAELKTGSREGEGQKSEVISLPR